VNILKASFDHLVLPLRDTVYRLSELGAAITHRLRPNFSIHCLLDRIIVRHEESALGLQFQVTTTGEVLESLIEEMLLVGDASL
jgi:hypothetical protein